MARRRTLAADRASWHRNHRYGLWRESAEGWIPGDRLGIDETRGTALREAGGIPVSSAAEAAAESDVVLTALPNTDALVDAVEGEFGFVHGAHDDLIVVEMSTFPLEAKERARAALQAAGGSPYLQPGRPAMAALATAADAHRLTRCNAP